MATDTKAVFDHIYRKRVWGAAGSGSGLGSNLKYARGAAQIVARVVAMLGVHSLLDAPCGAREWQTPLVHALQHKDPHFRYLGLDVSSNALLEHRDSLLPTRQQDLASTPLASGFDLVLTRDALQHNTQDNVFKILRNFACSDASYFLIGSYPDSKQNVQIATGDYFAIDLRKPPYSLDPWKDFNEHTADRKHLYLSLTQETFLPCHFEPKKLILELEHSLLRGYNRTQLAPFGRGCGSPGY